MLEHQVRSIHPQQYDEIREDEGLSRRVDQMRQEDAAIIETAGQLGEEIPRFQTAAASVEPDEAKLRTAFDAFVESACSRGRGLTASDGLERELVVFNCWTKFRSRDANFRRRFDSQSHPLTPHFEDRDFNVTVNSN